MLGDRRMDLVLFARIVLISPKATFDFVLSWIDVVVLAYADFEFKDVARTDGRRTSDL
jgi:hypothetical protein